MGLIASHCVFPTPDMERTAAFYHERLGFRRVDYLEVAKPHVCLYRDGIEVILTRALAPRVIPNRELYGYGSDAYLITDDREALQAEFEAAGVAIVERVRRTDYGNEEFTIEDIDGRWLTFGLKLPQA